jgi:hypothetical protein
MSSPPEPAPPTSTSSGDGLRFSPWNLLLLVPFLMLVVPWFNSDQPRLFGLPFFYWAQFAFVPIGVICVGLVYVMTRDARRTRATNPAGGVDELDEGTRA